MDLLQVTILSIVEGLTEFLPISSTGHLILVADLLGIPASSFTKTFEIAIQLGAIFAVVVLYYKKFFLNSDLYKRLFVAFLPTALVGFFLYPLIKNYFLESTQIVTWSLLIGGIALILFEKLFTGKNIKSLSLSQYLVVGMFQSISVIPGVSRAAATIVGGMLVGLPRKEAVEFSFLLAVPTMAAATGYDLYKSAHLFNSQELLTLGAGFILSFVFAMLAIKFFINFVKKNDFTIFGFYRVALALTFWILSK